MKHHFGPKLALAGLMAGAYAASADATTSIMKGGGIITNRSPASGACDAAFDIGDAFVIEYRPNFGGTTAETMTIFTAQMAFLVTSTDANKKLVGAGTESVASFAFGKGQPLQSGTTTAGTYQVLPPGNITTSTKFVGLIATNVPNFGVLGCTVSFSAGLARYFAPTPF